MTLEDFYRDLAELAKRHELQNTPLKIEKDLEGGIIKIFGEQITPLARARSGIEDVAELAYATAEHHPYWKILSHSSEIASSVLERWNDRLTGQDLSEMEWAIGKLGESLEKARSGARQR